MPSAEILPAGNYTAKFTYLNISSLVLSSSFPDFSESFTQYPGGTVSLVSPYVFFLGTWLVS